MSASAAPVVSVSENVPGQQVVMSASAVPVVSVSKNVPGQQDMSASATPVVNTVVSETRTMQHEQSVNPGLAQANTTTPQSKHSDVHTPSEGGSSVGPTSAQENSTPPWEVETQSEGDSSVSPASPQESTTPPLEVETLSEGDSSVSPSSVQQSSTPPLGNVTLISSDEEIDQVTKHDSSKSTLTSSCSTSRTDEELATSMVDSINMVIEPIQEAPETQRCKF